MMLEGLSPYFRSADDSYWHVSIDFALMKNRHGDAAGIAMGRIGQTYEEAGRGSALRPYSRIVRTYEVPLVAQIIAPLGDQIYISTVVKFILALRQVLGFNITSVAADQFASADALQQLALAGLVTPGMQINELTGEPEGIPKPWSVDGGSVQPYRELLEAVNEGRVTMPQYGILRRELRGLENIDPGFAPDHSPNGSKDVADACASCIGYLAAFGHQEISIGDRNVGDAASLREEYDLPMHEPLTVGGHESSAGMVDLDA